MVLLMELYQSPNFTVGQKDLNANYAGIPRTVGLLGSEANLICRSYPNQFDNY